MTIAIAISASSNLSPSDERMYALWRIAFSCGSSGDSSVNVVRNSSPMSLFQTSFDVFACKTPFKGSSFSSSDCSFVGHRLVPSTIGNNPRMSRTVRIRNFHVWKFAALLSSDGMSYRRLEARIELDDGGFDPDGG